MLKLSDKLMRAYKEYIGNPRYLKYRKWIEDVSYQWVKLYYSEIEVEERLRVGL